MIKQSGLLLILILFLSACEEKETYSEIPEIQLISFYTELEHTVDFGDILYGHLTFSFVDGDGDIGFFENSDSSYDGPVINDMFIFEFTKTNGDFEIEDTVEYVLPSFNQGVLKGTVDVKLRHTVNDADTVYYEFYIIDRAYNVSNIITTPTYIYSELAQQ
jgi:hypothetical protein